MSWVDVFSIPSSPPSCLPQASGLFAECRDTGMWKGTRGTCGTRTLWVGVGLQQQLRGGLYTPTSQRSTHLFLFWNLNGVSPALLQGHL